MKKRLLTFNEAREYLRINKGTLHKLIHNGEIPAFRVGNLWRIDSEELIKWLKKSTKKKIKLSNITKPR